MKRYFVIGISYSQASYIGLLLCSALHSSTLVPDQRDTNILFLTCNTLILYVPNLNHANETEREFINV